jgi:hypothetical protein
VFHTTFADKNQNAYLTSKTFLENPGGIYEIMCKNIVESDRPQMTIWRMDITCWDI